MVEFMRNSDAFALGMEQDARLRSTIVTIILLDRSPDWAVLLDRFERIVRLMPMFRQRVVPALLQTPPRWVYDADFDLRYHVSRVTAPDPGDAGRGPGDGSAGRDDRVRPRPPAVGRDPGGRARRRRCGPGGAGCTTRWPTASAASRSPGCSSTCRRSPPTSVRCRPSRTASDPARSTGVTPVGAARGGRAGRSRGGRAVRTAPSLLAGSVLRPLSTAADGGGDRRLGLPHGPADQPDGVADHAGAGGMLRELGVHEVPLSTLKEAGAPRRRHAQRRVPRRR